MVRTEAAPAAIAPQPRDDAEEPMTLGLWLIVAMKGITALLLWCGFSLLLVAHRGDPSDFFRLLIVRAFRGDPPGIAIRYIATNTEFITQAMVARIAIATAIYAAVESAEAIGLLLRKIWAEWLVVLVTISFIPVEIYEITMRPNPFKVATLIANIVILWYLLRRLAKKHREAQTLQALTPKP